MKVNDISVIVKKNLCIQCGTCVSICPNDAISINELRRTGLIYPSIDDSLCINCGLCKSVCPVNDFSLFTKPIEVAEKIGIYESFSNNDEEQLSSSGGAISTILKFLFRNKMVDKAIVVVMPTGKILEPEGVIISNELEVDQARGSIYQPVPLNVVLKGISYEDRIAFVGLPCHIKGLVKYLEVAKNINSANVYKLGIFCNIGRSRNATRFLTNRYKKRVHGKIKSIHYRRGEYPGFLCLESDQGHAEVSYKEYMTRIGYFFTPKGCLFCDDLFNEKADISVGDPWGLVKEKKALIISRNRKGWKIIQEMMGKGLLKEERTLASYEALGTQNYKYKENRKKRSLIYAKLGISIPSKLKEELKLCKIEKVTIFDFLLSIILLINSFLFNSRLYFLANLIPYKILLTLSKSIKSKYK